MILIFFGQGPWIVRKNLVWLSDSQWKRIEPQLPTNVRGFDPVDDRCVISGIAHVQKSGCRWSDCLLEFQPPTTIHIRFVRWARRGIWEDPLQELAKHSQMRGASSPAIFLFCFSRAYSHARWSPAKAGNLE